MLKSAQVEARTFNFPSGGALYQLHDDATESNIQDQLTARLTQLDAMFGLITGESLRVSPATPNKLKRITCGVAQCWPKSAGSWLPHEGQGWRNMDNHLDVLLTQTHDSKPLALVRLLNDCPRARRLTDMENAGQISRQQLLAAM